MCCVSGVVNFLDRTLIILGVYRNSWYIPILTNFKKIYYLGLKLKE
jgi:hypothetical protein